MTSITWIEMGYSRGGLLDPITPPNGFILLYDTPNHPSGRTAIQRLLTVFLVCDFWPSKESVVFSS